MTQGVHEMNKTRFAENLITLRKENKLTQEDAASHLKISRQAYANYERSHREPSLINLVKLADLFHVSIDFLVGRENMNNIHIEKILKQKTIEKTIDKKIEDAAKEILNDIIKDNKEEIKRKMLERVEG